MLRILNAIFALFDALAKSALDDYADHMRASAQWTEYPTEYDHGESTCEAGQEGRTCEEGTHEGWQRHEGR